MGHSFKNKRILGIIKPHILELSEFFAKILYINLSEISFPLPYIITTLQSILKIVLKLICPFFTSTNYFASATSLSPEVNITL